MEELSDSDERWSDGAAPAGDWDDSDEAMPEEDETLNAGKQLIDFLLVLLWSGSMSARTLCTICWWVCKASPDISKYAKVPRCQSGKFQAHSDDRFGVFGVAGHITLSLRRFRSELSSYYKSVASKVTKLQFLSLSMLGSATKHARMPFKGAEAKGLIPFVVQLLGRFLPGCDLHVAGEALLKYIDLCDRNGLRLSEATQLEMRQSAVTFLGRGIRGGMRSISKVHQMLHMIHDSTKLHGNPRFAANFLDESLNKDLAGVARAAYSTVWVSRIFICWKRLRASRPRGLTLA